MDFKKLNEHLEIHKPKGGYKENKDFYEKEKIRYIRESPLPKEYFNTTSHMSFKSMPIKNNSTFRFIFYKFLEDRGMPTIDPPIYKASHISRKTYDKAMNKHKSPEKKLLTFK